MIGHGPDRGKILAKMHELFSHMPDKEGPEESKAEGNETAGNGSSAPVIPHVQPTAKPAFDPLGAHKGGRR